MKLKICPRCGSLNVKWIIPQNWSMWTCADCSYIGPIIEGDPELAVEIRKEYEENPKNTYDNKDKTPNNYDDEEELTDEEIEKRIDNLYK